LRSTVPDGCGSLVTAESYSSSWRCSRAMKWSVADTLAGRCAASSSAAMFDECQCLDEQWMSGPSPRDAGRYRRVAAMTSNADREAQLSSRRRSLSAPGKKHDGPAVD
jgi:hypothetical protein